MAERDKSRSLELFTGRQEQLAEFSDVLDSIKNQRLVTSNLLEHDGTVGIGKSELISAFAQRALKENALVAQVNFKEIGDRAEKYSKDPSLLFEDIVTSFKQSSFLETSEFDNALTRFRMNDLPEEGVVHNYSKMEQEMRLFKRPRWLTDFRELAVSFLKLVNTYPHRSPTKDMRPAVLLFDETDFVDTELIDFIEEWLINPTLQIKHSLVVWTGRSFHRWQRPEIRRRLIVKKLGNFVESETSEQIGKESLFASLDTELVTKIHGLTGGHPLANSIVIKSVEVLRKQGNEITPANFSSFEPFIAQKPRS